MQKEFSTTRWLTVDEVRDNLNISRTKAYELATSGAFETIKLGRILRINEYSLLRWLQSQRYPEVESEGRQGSDS
jgi:excisionase family DNA binding protein